MGYQLAVLTILSYITITLRLFAELYTGQWSRPILYIYTFTYRTLADPDENDGDEEAEPDGRGAGGHG